MKFAAAKSINIDAVFYPGANTLGAGINTVVKKELIDSGILECDYVQMYAMQRDPADFMNATFPTVSNGVVPDVNGDFKFSYIL